MRAEELCWLLKTDVVLEPLTILIRPKRCPQTGASWAPKHGHGRRIPVTDPALAEVVRRRLAASPGPWLFWALDTTTKQRGRWRSLRLLGKLKDRLKELGITRGTLHTFRHTLCSVLANDPRMPLPQLQRLMGHDSIETTMDHTHPRPGDIASSLAKVDFSTMLAPQQEIGKVKESGNQSSELPANPESGQAEKAA